MKRPQLRPNCPDDLLVQMVILAVRDAANGHRESALAFLMSDGWVDALDISPETVDRIRNLANERRQCGSNHSSTH